MHRYFFFCYYYYHYDYNVAYTFIIDVHTNEQLE